MYVCNYTHIRNKHVPKTFTITKLCCSGILYKKYTYLHTYVIFMYACIGKNKHTKIYTYPKEMHHHQLTAVNLEINSGT